MRDVTKFELKKVLLPLIAATTSEYTDDQSLISRCLQQLRRPVENPRADVASALRLGFGDE
jgi:hypothetical protein